MNDAKPQTSPVILFDMDDTLAATLVHWREAEAALWRWLGRPFDAKVALQYKGMNAPDIGRTVHRLLSPQASAEDCMKYMREGLIACFKKAPPAPMTGAVECVGKLAKDHRMAVASGSPLELIELTLENLGIRDAFEVILSSESVARGKPSPDVFIEAARLMKADAGDCLVMEDTLIGVQAARAAGMRCIAIPSVPPDGFAQLANHVCQTLEEVDSVLVKKVMANL